MPIKWFRGIHVTLMDLNPKQTLSDSFSQRHSYYYSIFWIALVSPKICGPFPTWGKRRILWPSKKALELCYDIMVEQLKRCDMRLFERRTSHEIEMKQKILHNWIQTMSEAAALQAVYRTVYDYIQLLYDTHCRTLGCAWFTVLCGRDLSKAFIGIWPCRLDSSFNWVAPKQRTIERHSSLQRISTVAISEQGSNLASRINIYWDIDPYDLVRGNGAGDTQFVQLLWSVPEVLLLEYIMLVLHHSSEWTQCQMPFAMTSLAFVRPNSKTFKWTNSTYNVSGR